MKAKHQTEIHTEQIACERDVLKSVISHRTIPKLEREERDKSPEIEIHAILAAIEAGQLTVNGNNLARKRKDNIKLELPKISIKEIEVFKTKCLEHLLMRDHDFFSKAAREIWNFASKTSSQKYHLKNAVAISALIPLWQDWGVSLAERRRRFIDEHGFKCSPKTFDVEHRRQLKLFYKQMESGNK